MNGGKRISLEFLHQLFIDSFFFAFFSSLFDFIVLILVLKKNSTPQKEEKKLSTQLKLMISQVVQGTGLSPGGSGVNGLSEPQILLRPIPSDL